MISSVVLSLPQFFLSRKGPTLIPPQLFPPCKGGELRREVGGGFFQFLTSSVERMQDAV